MGKRTQYSLEFKAEAVRLVLEQGYSSGQAAARLGVNLWTLRDWVELARKRIEPSVLLTQETSAQELKSLRQQVAQLKLENEILKKATAYFAKDIL